MAKKSIKDIDITNKKVLIRVDFNVPLDDNQKISDDTRIKAALPTIKYALEQKAAVILMSHLGRPKGKVVDSLRMDPVAERLSELLGLSVKKTDDCIGAEVTKAAADLRPGEVLLLENLRFHKEEKANDQEFAKALTNLAQVYVNDAFGSAHRAHASTEGAAKFLPAAAGFLLQKEIDYLGNTLQKPAKPFMAILGGAKVTDKIGVIENLLPKLAALVIGGGMAYTFLKAQGKQIGNSKLEADKIDLAKDILKQAREKGVEILLPVDHIITQQISPDAQTQQAGENIPEGWIGVDIGPVTIEKFKSCLTSAKTIVWNGPVGIFEIDIFAKGTKEIAGFIADLTDTVSIIGGGDTASAIVKFGAADKMSHISTGGGASLEFMEGKELPGVAALNDK